MPFFLRTQTLAWSYSESGDFTHLLNFTLPQRTDKKSFPSSDGGEIPDARHPIELKPYKLNRRLS